MNYFRLTGILLLLILFTLLSGCMASPSKRYYEFYLEPPPDGMAKIEKVLMVEPVEVAQVYDDYRLVYRVSPFQLNYYSYEFWIRMPGLALRDAIYDYFSKSGAFKGVIRKYGEGDPDWLLKAEVEAMEEYDQSANWYAHFKMKITVRDFKTNEIVVEHRFDRKEKLTEKKVSRVPILLSEILEQELTKIIKQLPVK